MKLIKLIVKEQAEEVIFFTIKIEAGFIFKQVKRYNCFRYKNSTNSRFIDDGMIVGSKYPFLDQTINAFFTKANKNYDEFYF